MHLTSVLAGTAAGVFVVAGLVASDASATPPSDPPPIGAAVAAPATLDGPSRARADGIALSVREDATVRSLTLTYGPGTSSGWHKHPGVVLAVVQSGSVQRTLPCGDPQTFTVGQAFTEVGPHLVENITDTPASLVITHVLLGDVPPEQFRIDLPEPSWRCHHHHR